MQFSRATQRTQSNGAGGTAGSDDCLTLNVYVPDTEPPEDGFPVLAWIHGGWLVKGSGIGLRPNAHRGEGQRYRRHDALSPRLSWFLRPSGDRRRKPSQSQLWADESAIRSEVGPQKYPGLRRE